MRRSKEEKIWKLRSRRTLEEFGQIKGAHWEVKRASNLAQQIFGHDQMIHRAKQRKSFPGLASLGLFGLILLLSPFTRFHVSPLM
jgi:hypothetical protein